jgi:hypothetical protein
MAHVANFALEPHELELAPAPVRQRDAARVQAHRLARVGGARVGEASPPPTTIALHYLAGDCNVQSAMSCPTQRILVFGLTGVGALALGLFSGSLLWALLGAAAGNFGGRKLTQINAQRAAPACMGSDERKKLLDDVL